MDKYFLEFLESKIKNFNKQTESETIEFLKKMQIFSFEKQEMQTLFSNFFKDQS